jgi:putative peptide zinc metalloprotease protein
MNSSIPSLAEFNIVPADVNEEGKMYIVSMEDGSFFKISESAKLIIEEIDGIKSYDDIVKSLKKKYGVDLNLKYIENFIVNKLIPTGIVKIPGSENITNSRSILWFHFPLINETLLSKICTKLLFLFNLKFILACGIFAISIVYYTLHNYHFTINKLMSYKINTREFFSILILYLASLIFHELGHATSCYYYKVKPRSIGIGIYLFMPVFYADLSETWLLNRKQRLVTDISGTYFQVVIILFLSLIIFINNQFFNIIVYLHIFNLSLLTILFNLNPLTRKDGYWILSDITGLVNVHRRIRSNTPNLFKIFSKSKKDNNVEYQDYKLKPSMSYFLKVWSIGYVLITSFILLRIIYYLFTNFFNNKFGISDLQSLLLVLIVLLQFILPPIRSLLGRKKVTNNILSQ